MSIKSITKNNTASKSILSKVFTRPRKTITTTGGAAISTSQYVNTGASIYFDGAGDGLSIATSTDFAIGNQSFCIEGWIYLTAIKSFYFCDFRLLPSQITPTILYEATPTPRLTYYTNGGYRITYNWTPALNQWHHIAVARNGTTTKMFVNGTAVGSTYTDTNNYVSLGAISISKYWGNPDSDNMKGYMDEFRITKGIARYTANFTPSTDRLVNDDYTILMLHFDGENGSTVINDDNF